jgi:hypothetical protein
VDSSYSKSIDTSNIEYLINNGQPGFYGLYVRAEDKFYYKYLNEFVSELHFKDDNWENQESHTIRFDKVLDDTAVNNIFDIALSEGKKSRSILFRTIEIGNLIPNEKGNIVIDVATNEIIDDIAIRRYVEENGAYLINSSQWKSILDYHNKATGKVATSSKYCLFVAASFLYSGDLFESYSWFKKSIRIRDGLSKVLIDYRTIHYAVLQRRLAIIDDAEYAEKISKIDDTSIFRLYDQLGEITASLRNFPNSPTDNFKDFEERIFEVINNPSTPINIVLIYENEYLLRLGYRFNMLFVTSVAKIKDAELNNKEIMESTRAEESLACIDRGNHWHSQMEVLKEKAELNGQIFIFNSTIVNEARVIYQFQVFEEKFNLTLPINKIEIEQKKIERLKNICSRLDQVLDFYESIGHKENFVGVLGVLYEIESFKNLGRDSNLTKKRILKAIEEIDSKTDQKKLNFLLSGGTTHEQFEKSMGPTVSRLEAESEIINQLKSEMIEMDQKEVSFSREGTFVHINLFPIGYFAIPENMLDQFFDLINISKKALVKVESMLEMKLVARLNLLYDPIPEEGFLDGYWKEQDINGLKRLHLIRTFLFESKSHRLRY